MKSNTNLVFKNEKVKKTIYNTISIDGLHISLFYHELINHYVKNILLCMLVIIKNLQIIGKGSSLVG